jgi:hypothetical protein
VKTDELIDDLSRGLAPASGRDLLLRQFEGVGAGALVSFALMWLWLGLRPDLAQAMATPAYWMKFGYTLLFALFAYWAVGRLGRPSLKAGAALAGLGIVFALLGSMAMMRWMQAAPPARMHLLMGDSARVCSWRIIVLSVPVFAGTFWSLRAFAPTQLVLTGAMAGLASGALGAWIYAFHCNESAAPFVLVFYTAGIAVAGLAGSLIARWLLRW